MAGSVDLSYSYVLCLGGFSSACAVLLLLFFPVPEHFRGTKFPHGQTTPSHLHFDS